MCTESGGLFSLTSTVKVCLPFEESNCVPVSILAPEKKKLSEMSPASALGGFYTVLNESCQCFLTFLSWSSLCERNVLFQP